LDPELLFKIVQFYVPKYLPIDTFLRRIPKIGPHLPAVIPITCYNYIDIGLSDEQRLQFAVMDTYDALGAKYDFPKTKMEVQQIVDLPQMESADVFYGSNGIVANVKKRG
jgi:hypothetical protein